MCDVTFIDSFLGHTKFVWYLPQSWLEQWTFMKAGGKGFSKTAVPFGCFSWHNFCPLVSSQQWCAKFNGGWGWGAWPSLHYPSHTDGSLMVHMGHSVPWWDCCCCPDGVGCKGWVQTDSFLSRCSILPQLSPDCLLFIQMDCIALNEPRKPCFNPDRTTHMHVIAFCS